MDLTTLQDMRAYAKAHCANLELNNAEISALGLLSPGSTPTMDSTMFCFAKNAVLRCALAAAVWTQRCKHAQSAKTRLAYCSSREGIEDMWWACHSRKACDWSGSLGEPVARVTGTGEHTAPAV